MFTMAPSSHVPADVEQARYLAAELERWVDQLANELDYAKAAVTITAKRSELYDVQRQLKALRDNFPQAFT